MNTNTTARTRIHATPAAALDTLARGWGQDWRIGLLVDHLAEAEASGVTIRRTAGGGLWAYAPGRSAVRVVCGDLVWIWTEDGRMDGRCGQPALADLGACEAHAADREAYLAQTEAEMMAWERENDRI